MYIYKVASISVLVPTFNNHSLSAVSLLRFHVRLLDDDEAANAEKCRDLIDAAHDVVHQRDQNEHEIHVRHQQLIHDGLAMQQRLTPRIRNE